MKPTQIPISGMITFDPSGDQPTFDVDAEKLAERLDGGEVEELTQAEFKRLHRQADEKIRELSGKLLAAEAWLKEAKAELNDWIENRGPRLAIEAVNEQVAEANSARRNLSLALEQAIAQRDEADTRALAAEARLKEAEGKYAQLLACEKANVERNERVTRLWKAAEARLKDAEEKRDGWFNRCQEVMAQLDSQSYLFMKLELEKAEADAGRLRAALEVVEWVGKEIPYCLWCLRSKSDGHSTVCARQAALRPAESEQERKPTFDLIRHLHRQRVFSLTTFGPGRRTAGVINHIRKELKEIEEKPGDLKEWVDVTLLALDGAWRAGFEPEEIANGIEAKQTVNEGRQWPDWRTCDPNNAIEHVRPAEEGEGK